jgi:hypothetical protein
MVAAAVIGGVKAAWEIGNGIAQMIKSKKINPVRPTYDFETLNKGGLENRNMFKNLMNGGMPGLQKASADIMANQSNIMAANERGATDANTQLLLANSGQARTNDAITNLGVQNAQFSANQAGNLASANAGLDQGRAQAFQFNEVEPYLDKKQQKEQLMQSGMANISGGLGSAASAAGGIQTGQNNQNNINTMQRIMAKGNGIGQADWAKYGIKGV